jgi:hypothetical protein
MSWHDPARTLEPKEDAALRQELCALLGVGPRNYFETEATPELNRLADDLRREAKRRIHTSRQKSSWMLMAAALPFALALGGVGAWGMVQKHKADGFAAAYVQQQTELQRMAATLKATPPVAQESRAVLVGDPKVAGQRPANRQKPKELVIPVERSADPVATDTQRVKGH